MDSEPAPPCEQPRFFGNSDGARWALVVVCVVPFLTFFVAALIGGHLGLIAVTAVAAMLAVAFASAYLRLGYELDGHMLRSGQRGKAAVGEGIDLRQVYRTGPARKGFLDFYTDGDADRREQGRGPVGITRLRMSQTAQRELREVMEREYGIDCSTFRIALGERSISGT